MVNSPFYLKNKQTIYVYIILHLGLASCSGLYAIYAGNHGGGGSQINGKMPLYMTHGCQVD